MQKAVEDRAQIVVQHVPLARSIARRMHRRLPPGVDLDDLVSAAVTGLLEAADRYDPSRSASFRTFASHRIRGAVVDALRGADWAPRTARRRVAGAAGARKALTERLGRAPTRDEVASELGITPDRLDRTDAELGRMQAPLSLESELDHEPAGGADPAMSVIDEQLRQRILDGLQALPERERTAIALVYLHELSLGEVGRVLGVSPSRVCQLCSRGLGRLREQLRDLA